MRLGEFLRKSAFFSSWHSSLALASSKPRLASDELHRSLREQTSSPREWLFVTRHGE